MTVRRSSAAVRTAGSTGCRTSSMPASPCVQVKIADSLSFGHLHYRREDLTGLGHRQRRYRSFPSLAICEQAAWRASSSSEAQLHRLGSLPRSVRTATTIPARTVHAASVNSRSDRRIDSDLPSTKFRHIRCVAEILIRSLKGYCVRRSAEELGRANAMQRR